MRASRMGGALVLVGAALAGAALADGPAVPPSVPAAAPSVAAAPRLVVDPPGFDFGRALPEKELAKEFRLRNVGTRDLLIDRVTASCGCTVVGSYDKQIRPGGSSTLRVTLHTRGAGGSRLVKSVLVVSNDPAHPTLEIPLSAEVVGGPPPTQPIHSVE